VQKSPEYPLTRPRLRRICYATCRFAAPPRFELVRLISSIGRNRWLRIGRVGDTAAELHALYTRGTTNLNLPFDRKADEAAFNKQDRP